MNKLVNIRKKNGKVQRIPRSRAEVLVDAGKATYLSKTLYKAAVVGVEVKKGMSDQDIKKLIRKVRKPEKKEPSDGQRTDQKKSKKRQRSRTN